MHSPLSIVVPTLNSASGLPLLASSLIEGVRAQLVRELIVADGGSTDETATIADGLGATLLGLGRGRGRQLAAGAGAARGDWLLFLHADTTLAEGWAAEVARHIANEPESAAYFKLRFARGGAGAAWVAGWANFRSAVFGLPYGDQGLLISRRLYEAVGGYPDTALMEDVAIVRALRGRKRALDGCAVTDPRRYLDEGWFARGSRNLLTLVRYFLGTPPEQLMRGYDRQRNNCR